MHGTMLSTRAIDMFTLNAGRRKQQLKKLSINSYLPWKQNYTLQDHISDKKALTFFKDDCVELNLF